MHLPYHRRHVYNQDKDKHPTCLSMLERVYDFGNKEAHIKNWDHDLHKGGVL